MSDPVPSATPDPDAADAADAADQRLPANAEDRKAAAALSSLNSNDIGAETGTKPPSSTDQEMLGKAMNRLEFAAGQDPKKKAPQAQKEAEVVKKKAVKVASEDVSLLVDQLELNKIKATELLKANEGDATRALRAFIAVKG
ncbi:hypothetical protein PHISP_02619 [Aspergillus sp. HF37]|nr:hypothetical protein PHISP_02619 [Aspergillus sp. HF37]